MSQNLGPTQQSIIYRKYILGYQVKALTRTGFLNETQTIKTPIGNKLY